MKLPTSDATCHKYWFTVTSSLRQASIGLVFTEKPDQFSLTTNPKMPHNIKKIIIHDIGEYRTRRKKVRIVNIFLAKTRILQGVVEFVKS